MMKKLNDFLDYYDVAHKVEDGNMIWVFKYGDLQVHSVIEGSDHVILCPSMNSNDYRGRYDKRKNIISIVNPRECRKIPNCIANKLYGKFGHTAEIYEF